MIFYDWPSHAVSAFARSPMSLKHYLTINTLFTREALARLISNYPKDQYNLVHMGEQGSTKKEWRYGKIGNMSGERVIRAIENNRLWINLLRVNEVDPQYQELLDAIYDELSWRVPHLPKTFKRICGILISSPGAQVYYHFDTSGQNLWQIQGTKTLWLYPTTEPFLKPKELEQVTLYHNETTIEYQPWYDEYATRFDLRPGDMVQWPLNAPHRIENGNELSVSLTTEYYTDDIQRHMRAASGNGLLRGLGFDPKPTPYGIAYYGKLATFAAYRATGQLKHHQKKSTAPSFLLSDGIPGTVAYANSESIDRRWYRTDS
jgi:hypothetical protein